MNARPQTSVIPRELWTAPQLAAYLGKPVKYVYRLTHERRIDHYVIGRELRFDPAHVADFLADAHYEIHTDEPPHVQPTTGVTRARAGRPRIHGTDGAVS